MKKTPRPYKFAVEKYRLNHSVKETATYFNLTLTTMEKILNEYGIYGEHYLERLNAPSELTAEQKEIITGNLLGDGWLNYLKSNNSNSNFGIEQKLANYYYVTDLHNIYKPFSKKYTQGKREKPLIINGKPSRSIWNGEYLYWCKFETMKHPIFTRLREKWYVDPFVAKSLKIIPKDIKITWKTIAYWACDDGSNDHKKRGFIFYTNGFKGSEVEFLLEIFANQFGIKGKVYGKNKSPILYFYGDNADEIKQNISQFIPWECFSYKLISNKPKVILRSSNKSGYVGVIQIGNSWIAYGNSINFQKGKYLGSFKTKNEAIEKRKQWEDLNNGLLQ